MTQPQKRKAYKEGYNRGVADRRIGHKSDYAWQGAERDSPATYSHWYSLGYRAAFNLGSLYQRNPYWRAPMHVASLLFDARVFTPAQAKAWAHAHGFKYGLVETPGPHGQYLHLPQHHAGRVTRIVSLGGTRSGIRAIVARNPSSPSFHYVYRPGILDRTDPTVMRGRPIAPNTLVRVLAKRPAGGKAIRGWSRTFAWIADAHGNEQIIYRAALQKTSATGY